MEQIKQVMEALLPKEANSLQLLLSQPTKRLILHSDIELTEDEIAEALISAKADKALKIKFEQNEKIRREASKELMGHFTSADLVKFCTNFFIQRFNQEFLIDEQNREIVKILSQYFSGDPEFEKAGYSLSKGILLMGNVGSGKTTLMRFFQKNKKSCFAIKSCKDISGEYSVYKSEIDDVYSTPIEKPLHDPAVFFQRYIGYCFDDLGTEEVKNDFGNKKNVMADIISAIYDKKDYSKFHITTNLGSKDEITERYGSRVNSRLREMFNVLQLNGQDRRK